MSGLAYQAEGKLEASVTAFKHALKIKPDAIEPLTQLIRSYMALDRAKKAISYLKKLTKKNKKNFIAYNMLGDLYLQKKLYNDADKAFRQSLKIKPQWVKNYQNIAAIYLLKKDNRAAIKILQKGINKTESSLVLLNELAAIYLADKQPEEALKLYELAYQKQPNSIVAINNLVRYLVLEDNSDKALKRAEQLVAKLEQSSNPEVMDTVAWVAYKTGSYHKAQKILQQIADKGIESSVVNYHLGMVYFQQGNNKLAKNYLDKAIAFSTPFEGVELAREVLQSIKGS